MIKLTGLYKATSKDGQIYLSGKTQDGVKYLVFRNKKQKDTHPDYNLFVEGGKEEQPKPKPYQNHYQENSPEVSYDDLPF
jgi:hypothetical protein